MKTRTRGQITTKIEAGQRYMDVFWTEFGKSLEVLINREKGYWEWLNTWTCYFKFQNQSIYDRF